MSEDAAAPPPRSYVSAATLLRRSEGGRARVPETLAAGEIDTWLLGEALAISDPLVLFEQFVWRLVASGFPLDRASLHVGTLHPQIFGFAWQWNSADGLCDEVKVSEFVLQSEGFLRSPLAVVRATGQALCLDTHDPATAQRYPLMADLVALGISQYLAIPLNAAGYHNLATIATRQPDGFSDAELDTIHRLLGLLALHVERHIALRIAGNVLDTYLGADAGRQVLQGSIKRGTGRRIEAVIWSSDLREFTDMADRLAPSDVIAVLNAYFEAMAGAVIEHGGEVLKFIGDGLLAVFPLEDDAGRAAEAALESALAAERAVAALNRDPPDFLKGIDGWGPLRSGIALHRGGVFFGNVGAPERLDFTVIGAAVNAASRVETLTKSLGRSILLTEPVAAELKRPLDDLGAHALRGLAEPMRLFAPRG